MAALHVQGKAGVGLRSHFLALWHPLVTSLASGK